MSEPGKNSKFELKTFVFFRPEFIIESNC